MADEVKKKDTVRHISEDERFKFIGFEVYPGKPKDLFKSDAERAKLVEAVQEKRKKGDVTRDECTLFDERVSFSDRLVLTIASVAIILALFFPWFTVYNEVVKASPAATETSVVTPTAPEGSVTPPAAPSADAGEATGTTNKISESEEVIHGYVAKRSVQRDYKSLSGFDALISLGSVGSVTFSSGLALMLTSLLGIAFILLCLALPAYTLYGVWMLKGTSDERSVKLKKILRLNWLPLIIFGAAMFFAFFGADYSRPVANTYSSLGDSYGIGVFIGTLSWGIFVTLAASILAAAKGSEI